MRYRIALLAIVGMIATLQLSSALGKARSPALASAQSRFAQSSFTQPVLTEPVRPSTDAQAAAAEASRAADEGLVEARQAFVKNDPVRFEQAAARASGHMLADYLDFWRLRMRLQTPTPDADTGAADAEIQRFLLEHSGTIMADLMRRDWMRDLADRRQWTLFDSQYAAWILRDDEQIDCQYWRGRIERGLPAEGALVALSAARSLGEGCGALMTVMSAAHKLDRGQVLALMLAGLEANSRDTVERTADLLDLDPVFVAAAWTRPPKVLAADPGREIALIAIVRMARDDPRAAAARLSEGVRTLAAADQSFAWSQIAASGMRQLAPESYEWARRGLHAPVGDGTLAWMARAALREQQWPGLRAIIEQMSDAGRRDPVWVYWHSRALLAVGEVDDARARLRTVAGQFNFYGQLAAEELGELVLAPPRAARPTKAELAQAANNPGFARALKFYDIGLRLEGNREWNFQLRGMSDRQLLAAAQLACRQGVLDRCVNTADRTVKEHDFSLRFVAPFLDDLKPVAAGRGLDPAWIYGLIRQESRFATDARSSAGAQGLMQIMPATARWIAGKLGVKNFRAAQLHDLPTNLEFGTFYLRTVLDGLDGSPVLASAAYNAGPGRPRDWRATLPGPVEGAIFAEIIPFSETRDYVKKVLSNAVIYASLFSGKPQSLKTRLGNVIPRAPVGVDIP